MRKISFLFACAIIVLQIGLASALFNVYNYTIKDSYSSGESLSGTVDINFSNQQNLELTSNFGGGISLADILSAGNYDFSCYPYDCKDGYIARDSAESDFALSGEKSLGIAITGFSDVAINSLNIDISSDAADSCGINQLNVDLLKDNSADFYNTNYLDSACEINGKSREFGCFDEDETMSNISIEKDKKLCEKITLPPAPAYRIGANIIKRVNSKAGLLMSIYKEDGSILIGGCRLQINSSLDFQTTDCIMNYSSKQAFSSLVCIHSNASNSNYSIRSEAGGEICGNYNNPQFENFVADYELYAFPLKYAPIINFKIDSAAYSKINSGQSLSSLLNEYIQSKYNGNCTKTCVIPFAISGLDQNIQISNVNLAFDSNAGATSTSNLVNIGQNKSVISTGRINLNLSYMNLTLSGTNTSGTFHLYLGNEEILSKKINVSGGFDFDLSPKVIAVGQNIAFKISISKNISSSIWNFGDGSNSVTTSGTALSHKYASSGEFILSIKVTATDGSSSYRTFKIYSGNAQDSANLTLTDYRERINKISSKLNSYPEWISDQLKKELNLKNINDSVVDIEYAFDAAKTDSDYESILSNLSNLNVPINIYSSESGSNLPMAIAFKNIDAEYALFISNAESDDADVNEIKQGIVSWINENYNPKISFDVISAETDSGTSPILTKFRIELNPKTEAENVYFIMGYPSSSISFPDGYGEKEIMDGSAAYFEIGERKIIEFSLPQKVLLEELGAYVSPDVSELPAIELPPEQPEPKFSWSVFIFGLLGVMVAFLIVYIILQEWYKKNYENLLFKNRDDLLNIINFIYNSRLAGLKDSEIRKKLGLSGWSGEQLNYAFNKIDGKRTGMWEIPLFKFVENKNVRREIERRHPEGIDTRFINRPNF